MSKNIIICCDGTGNQYCRHNTNVARLFEIIDNHTPEQIGYYDPGVGTLGSRVAVTRLGKFITKVMGLAFAYGIKRNIEEAYEFLMNSYEKDDKVFLFGFSRGAYTVRALAGMLMKCGLLYRGSKNQIPYAANLYANRKIAYDDPVLSQFRRTFSRECFPYFIGVWDTVKSVGIYNRYKFSDTKLNKRIPFGFHAVAVDEKRIKYRPVLWDDPEENQTIEQIWFPGVHSDVGGSYAEVGLSNTTLKWMIGKAVSCGLAVKKEPSDDIEPDYCDTLHNPLWPIWWILGWKSRFIAKDSTVHESAYLRMEEKPDYRPGNLPDEGEVDVVR